MTNFLKYKSCPIAQSFRLSNLLLEPKNVFYDDFAYEVKKFRDPLTMIICLQEQD